MADVRRITGTQPSPRSPETRPAGDTTPLATGRATPVAKPQDVVAHDSTRSPALEPLELDQLWASRAFDKVLDFIDGEITRLAHADLGSLGVAGLQQWVETLYLRQHQLIGLANNADLRGESGLARRALDMLRRLGEVQTPIFEEVATRADATDKAPVEPWQVFCNTLKKPGYHSLSETQKYFVEKLRGFVAKGGDFRDIQIVSAPVLQSLKNGDLCEWVVDKFDVARLASSRAKVAPGHTLLAWGQDALAAGSLRVFKDAKGEIQQAIVGTFSGHYRSGAAYAAKLVSHLVAAGVPLERIVVQGGEAGTPRTLEILYRTLGRDGAALQRETAALETTAARFNPAAPAPKEPKPPESTTSNGDGIWPQTAQLNEARARMNQTLIRVLSSGVVLTSPLEREEVTAAITSVLGLAEAAGNREAYDDALATLKHLATLDDVRVDRTAKTALAVLYADSMKHVFGRSASDIANILGPPPPTGRRTRIIAALDAKLSEADIRTLITAGMDTARLTAKVGDTAELQRRIETLRKAEVGLRHVHIMLDLPALDAGKRFETYEKLLTPILADVDVVGLPGVTDLSDVLTLRGLMKPSQRVVPIVALIDSKAAVDNLERIASAADGLAMNRTALATALGEEVVPGVVRQIYDLGNDLGRASVTPSDLGTLFRKSRSGRTLDSEIDGVYDAVREHGTEAVEISVPRRGADAYAEAIRTLARVIDRAESDSRAQLYMNLATSSPEAAAQTPTQDP